MVGPIAVAMAALALASSRTWIRGSSALVLACSGYAGIRGYGCRVSADASGVVYRSPLRTIRIPWSRVRRIDRYTPGAGGAEYAFVTTRDSPPAGRWDITAATIQLQDRPGLVEALRQVRGDAQAGPGAVPESTGRVRSR